MIILVPNNLRECEVPSINAVSDRANRLCTAPRARSAKPALVFVAMCATVIKHSHMEKREIGRKPSRKAQARERKPEQATVRVTGPAHLLDRQKNKVRGLIGSQRGHAREAGDRIVRIRESVRRILAESRYELPTSFRSEFLEWLELAGRGAGATSLLEAASTGLVNGVIQTKATLFSEELAWAHVLLSRQISVLRDFYNCRIELETSYWNDDWSGCQKALKTALTTSGESFWLIDAEIALRQQFEGLEAQKAYATAVQDRHKGGLPGYLSFFSSVRNEERSTYLLFDEDFKDNLERTKVSRRVKNYLLYKVTRSLEASEASFANVLQLESGSSVVDLYETVIDLLQRCVVILGRGSWTTSAIDLLIACEPIGDTRVTKLLRALGVSGYGSLPTAIEQSRENFSVNLPCDFWQAAWPIVSERNRDGQVNTAQSAAARVEKLLLSLVHRDEAFEDSRVQLAKFTRNYSFLRSATAAGDFADFITMRVDNTPQTLIKPLLNSSSSDYLDDFGRIGGDTHRGDPSAPQQMFKPTEGAARGLQAYLQALAAANLEPDTALAIASAVDLAKIPAGLANLLRNLILQVYLKEGESDEAIRVIGEDVARTPSIIAAVPAGPALNDRGWESLSTVGDKIALALTLYAYWKQTDDSLRTTHLRFAFEDALASLGVFVASDLPHSAVKGHPAVIFFLRYICIPVLMDTSGLFSTTEELLDERLAILTLLAKADEANIEQYEDEAATIRASKLIKSGLDIVDSNRVAVDTGALTRWSIKRYRESYNRYQALRAAGIGSSEKFDILFERIKADPDQGAEHFTIPDNEADSLLLGILQAVKDRFLYDQQYGLEYFLGKRIRHGTISGHMRGPPENAKLITERAGPGRPYGPNTNWMPRLNFKTVDCAQVGANAFARFSEEYDKLIAEARDRDLHVLSAAHPHGLLDLQLDAFRYQIVRSMIRSDIDFDSFLTAYFTILWSLLDPALVATKIYLTESLKDRVVRLYGKLQEDLRLVLVQDDEAMQLSAAIQATSTAVQRELDIVGDWFVRGDSQGVTHLFDLEDVLEVAIQSALKSLPNFSPGISRRVSGDGKTTSAVLLTVVDIVFIVFDNIHQRARLGPRPTCTIEFALSDNYDRLSLKIVNPIGSSVDAGHTATKLDRIRRKIATDDLVKGAFVEGESGLLKIAAHARHHRGSEFFFDVVNGEFVTEIAFPIIYLIDRFSLAPPED